MNTTPIATTEQMQSRIAACESTLRIIRGWMEGAVLPSGEYTAEDVLNICASVAGLCNDALRGSNQP